MDLLQHARQLYAAGRMHDALEAAQAACDRSPKDAKAWCLLARISRYVGMPAASDDAFRRAASLDDRCPRPYRVSLARFQELVDEVGAALAAAGQGGLATTVVQVRPVPQADQVGAGVDPDALSLRDESQPDVLVLFQVNHENTCADEDALRELLGRSLSGG